MIGMMLVPIPVPSAEPNELPQECAKADFTSTGRPVMFPPRDGLSMGISTPRPTVDVRDPVEVYVWVNNQTDSERVLMSCSMWWDWGITVYDAGWHTVKTHAEQEEESKPKLKQIKICGRNIHLRVPPQSCAPLQDMGDLKIDLRKDRDLPTGEYFVTQNRLTLPLRGLKIVVENKTPSAESTR